MWGKRGENAGKISVNKKRNKLNFNSLRSNPHVLGAQNRVTYQYRKAFKINFLKEYFLSGRDKITA